MYNKKELFKERIDKIAKESFNEDQKTLAKKIIDNADDSDVDAVWQLVSQRVKTGFVFDKAPEINHNCVAYLKENEKLGINLDKKDALEHSLIIGENYDALKNLLAVYTDKQGKGLIDIIYIDPPYNTEKSKEEGNDYKEEVESNKFIYRDKFTRDGWLNMMNERLQLARKLLSDKGVIFISCDDSEQAYLKVLCDEIFGEENSITTFMWHNNKKGRQMDKYIKNTYENIFLYARNKKNMEINKKCVKIDLLDFQLKDEKSYYKKGYPLHNGTAEFDINNRPNLCYSIYYNLDTKDIQILDEKVLINNSYELKLSHKGIDLIQQGYIRIVPKYNEKYGTQRVWRWGKEKFLSEYKTELILEKEKDQYYFYQKDRASNEGVVLQKYTNYIDIDTSKGKNVLNKLFSNKVVFDFPKPVELIKYLMIINSCKNSTILDFFAGSGTTGQAVMELNEEDGGNRKFILVTNNENNIAKDVTRERLYRVINGKGSKGEDFEWQYSEDEKCLDNNSVRVFDIEKENLNITEIEKAEKIKKVAEENFVKLNPEYKKNQNLDIYNVLASLTPYKDKSEE